MSVELRGEFHGNRVLLKNRLTKQYVLLFKLHGRDRNAELNERVIHDLEEGFLDHRTPRYHGIDRDHLIESFHFLTIMEFVENEIDFLLLFFIESIAMRRWHTRHRARTDGDDLGRELADFQQLFLLLRRDDRPLDERHIHLIHVILRLEHPGIADIEDMLPHHIMVIHELRKYHRAILATGKREPSDPQFFLFSHTKHLIQIMLPYYHFLFGKKNGILQSSVT